ncbi:MAG: disulfide bond formation protein B, partial [Alphaproteobacteria bacterium]
HVAAVIFGALWFVRPSRVWLGLGAAAAAVTGAIGVYHAGVEQKWWQGPTTCTSGSIEGLSTDALLDRIMNAPVVRCDEIPWELFSISMAGWNAILSFVLAGLWILALRRD